MPAARMYDHPHARTVLKEPAEKRQRAKCVRKEGIQSEPVPRCASSCGSGVGGTEGSSLDVPSGKAWPFQGSCDCVPECPEGARSYLGKERAPSPRGSPRTPAGPRRIGVGLRFAVRVPDPPDAASVALFFYPASLSGSAVPSSNNRERAMRYSSSASRKAASGGCFLGRI